jgi:hypothetical protein
MKTFRSARVLRFVLAPMLSFWIAGAGCMLGCESMVAAAATLKSNAGHHSQNSSTIVASGHACSSQKSHDCCAKNRDEESSEPSQGNHSNATLTTARESSSAILITSRGSSSIPINCPFAVSRTAVVTKAQGRDTNASAVLAVSNPDRPNLLEQTAPLSPPLRLPNRGHTYLRCCVFLI